MLKRAMLTVIIFILPFTLSVQNTVNAADETTLNPTDDVFISNIYPSNTNSANKNLLITYTPGNDAHYISLFNFDLSEIPSMSEIESADLVLARQSGSDDVNVPFTASLITEAWVQQSVTWNEKPDIAGNKFPIASEDFMLGGRGYTRFDLIKLVQEWVKDQDNTYGFQLEGPKTMQYSKSYLSSRDVIAPRLVIEYSVLAGMIGEHGTIQKEVFLPPAETGDSMEESETSDMEKGIIMEDGSVDEDAEAEEDTNISSLEKNLAEVLTPNNIKIAAGAVFLLVLIKLVLSKR